MEHLEIKDDEFNKIREIMHRKTGVFLRDSKKPLVISRLRKRLIDLNLKSFKEYIDLIAKPGSEELEYFINAITTNETFFFRHSVQFDILKDKILPEFYSSGKRFVSIWSAASSTGEEPYSLAILCEEFKSAHIGFSYKIYATDINSEVLDVSKKGIYTERSLKETPKGIKLKYFKETQKDNFGRPLYEIDRKLRNSITFAKHNLLAKFKSY